jgi:hypothetical protein
MPTLPTLAVKFLAKRPGYTWHCEPDVGAARACLAYAWQCSGQRSAAASAGSLAGGAASGVGWGGG